MKTFSDIQSIVTAEIERLDWKKNPIGLYEPIGYSLSMGGKRIRPALALLATDMYNGNLYDVLPAAMALEVFHNFTLLHDDVMDKAGIRRGHATVHCKWNENTAILSGDAMLIEAYKLLARTPEKYLKQTLDLFSNTAEEICEGQQYDMDFEQRNDVSIEEYIEMIRLKTAVLLGMALKIGAIIANAPAQDAQRLYDFGINIGLAFQLKDDYLDVYGNEKSFGKAIGGDILCNKKTYMLLTAFKTADIKTKAELYMWLQADNDRPQEKIQAVTSIYNQLQVKEKCEEAMNFYMEQAVAILDKIDILEDKKQELRKLAQKLMVRNE